MCWSSKRNDDQEAPVNNTELDEGSVDIGSFNDNISFGDIVPNGDLDSIDVAPAYVQVPIGTGDEDDSRDVQDERTLNGQDIGLLYEGEQNEIPFEYEGNGDDKGGKKGGNENNTQYHRAWYGFPEPLPSGVNITFELEQAVKWYEEPQSDVNDGFEVDDGCCPNNDAYAEVGEVVTVFTFYDANGNEVHKETFTTMGGLYAKGLADGEDVPHHPEATDPSNVDGYIYDDLSNDPEDPEPTGPTSNGSGGMATRNSGQYVETRYFSPTFTSDEIAGASSVQVINEATSYDDEELTGIGDVGDDYQADPDVWAGIVDMRLWGNHFGQSPVCNDDGTVDAGVCADSDGLIIDVLANDDDPDNDPLRIGSVGNPSDGDSTTATTSDNGTDKIVYTPNPDTTGEVTFDYTVSDGNGGTDTATVTVNVPDGSCGSLTVNVEGPGGNPVSGATVAPQVDGTQLPQDTGQGGTASYNVEISDTPILTQMNESMIESVPDGFATSVEDVDKALEQTQGQEEPDDHWYPQQEREFTKSKLATDPDGSSPPSDCSTSTESIYSDFGDLDVESTKQTDEDGDIYNNNPPIPKTESVQINDVVSDSTESVGDLTISFADDPNAGLDPNEQPGFFALVDCMGGSNSSECSATSKLRRTGNNTLLRELTAQGGGSSPDDNTDTSDITMNVNMNDFVEIQTEASTNIGDNSSSHVQAGVDIADITLEVCD